MEIINIKIFDNFWTIIKSYSVILFVVFILASSLNSILDFALIIFKIKTIFNPLLF